MNSTLISAYRTFKGDQGKMVIMVTQERNRISIWLHGPRLNVALSRVQTHFVWLGRIKSHRLDIRPEDLYAFVPSPRNDIKDTVETMVKLGCYVKHDPAEKLTLELIRKGLHREGYPESQWYPSRHADVATPKADSELQDLHHTTQLHSPCYSGITIRAVK